jgi:hypothetical protein
MQSPQGHDGRKLRWNHRAGVALVLLVALSQAILYGFVLIPPWQAPDEPGHYEYVRSLSEYGLRKPTVSESETLQHEVIASLVEHRFWELMGRQAPDPRPQIFLHDPYLNSQREDEPPLYYLLPAILLDRGQTTLDRLYVIRGWSVILYLATIGFVYLGLVELSAGDRFLPLVGGLLAGLMPMPAFIGSAANNDVAAMAVSTIVFWLLIRSIRRRWPPSHVIGLAIMLVVASLTKKTTLFLWPLVSIVAVIDNRRLLWAWVVRHWRVMPATAFLMAAAAVVAWSWHTDGASGWVQPASHRVAERITGPVLSGSYALKVAPRAGAEPGRIVQELSYNRAVQYREQSLTLTAHVSSLETAGAGYVVVSDGYSSSRVPFRVGDAAWEQVATTHLLSASADRLVVVLANTGAGVLAFDTLSLQDAAGQEILTNGDGETAAHWIEGWIAHRLALSPGLMPRLLEPASYSFESMKRYLLYVLLTFAGFWANFGWLTVPLDPQWYLAPALLCIAAGAGMWRGWRRRRVTGASPHAGLAAATLAIVLIGLQTFVPMIGSAWQPQGRYLFPAILPIVAWLGEGWRDLTPARARPILGAFLIACFVAFGQLCIWNYVIPAYA